VHDGAQAATGFFLARWRGLVPLDRLFWRDMLLIGTGISLASSALALALLGAKLPLALVLAVHLATLPYSVFLFIAVWRTAAAQPGLLASLAQLGATLWLLAVTVL
jgi:hypothetical protein